MSRSSEDFLYEYKEHGKGMTGIQYVERTKRSKSTYYSWRKKIPGFTTQIQALEAENTNERPKEDPIHWMNTKGLDAWQIDFLCEYRKTLDTVGSLDKAMISLDDLKIALRQKKFAKIFKQIDEEINIGCRDVVKQSAIKKKSVSAAKIHLEATDPLYQKKMAVNHSHVVGSTSIGAGSWGAAYGFLTEGDDEVVDGEVIQEP